MRAVFSLALLVLTAPSVVAFLSGLPVPRRSIAARVAMTTEPEVDKAEPFVLVQSDLRKLKRRIKELVENNVGSSDKTKEGSTNPMLKQAAREFFERRERAWRPGVVLLMARALDEGETDEDGDVLMKQIQLAEIVEMMSTAQVIHDDVLEDFEASENGNVAHRSYGGALGNKVSLLAGDFLLARASVELAKLTNVAVVEIMGESLENMCRGEIMQAQARVEDKLNTTYYIQSVSLKTASLLAEACKCTALLRGDERSSPNADAAFEFGINLGIAYQISNDIITFTGLLDAHHNGGDAEEEEDAPQGALTPETMSLLVTALPPFALAAAQDESGALKEMAHRGFSDEGDVAAAIAAVDEVGGVALAADLAKEHITRARAAAAELPESIFKEGLHVMSGYIVEEDQKGLQRAEWMDLQQKKMGKH